MAPSLLFARLPRVPNLLAALRSFSAVGNNFPQMSCVPPFNPFKKALPMSDDNKTDTPYPPPVPSDEPLVKKESTSPKANLDPIHWLLPISGYAYVPFMLLLTSTQGDARGLLEFSLVVSLFGVPLYAAMLFGLNRMRNEQGTNTPGLKFYHGLSLTPPILWTAFIFFAATNGVFAY